MNPRNRVFIMLGVLALIGLAWYLFSTRRSDDMQLIGTVDANEVVVSSRIPGRIQKLAVDEGDDVTAGQLIATIESEDLAAATNAAKAATLSQKYKLQQFSDTERQTRGSTSSQVINAEAQLRAAKAALAQAQANYEHQQADTTRTVALAKQGVMSEQARDEAITSLDAAKAAVDAAQENVFAAEASLRVARANMIQAEAAAKTVAATRSDVQNARALLDQAQVTQGYSRIVAPVSGKVNVRAARQGGKASRATSVGSSAGGTPSRARKRPTSVTLASPSAAMRTLVGQIPRCAMPRACA